MVINLSEEVIETVYNSLRATKQDLIRQLNEEKNLRSFDKKVILKYQIEEVSDALQVFEELVQY